MRKIILISTIIKSRFILILTIVPILSFMAKENPRSCIAFIMYHVAFAVLWHGMVPQSFFVFYDTDIFEEMEFGYFVEHPLICV